MSDHRKEERIKAMIFTTVYELKGRILLGYLGDLTYQGGMVVGEKPVETGRDISLLIEFSGADELPASGLALPAHVAWCRQDGDSVYFHTGVEFGKLSEQNKGIIEELLTRYKFSRGIST